MEELHFTNTKTKNAELAIIPNNLIIGNYKIPESLLLLFMLKFVKGIKLLDKDDATSKFYYFEKLM